MEHSRIYISRVLYQLDASTTPTRDCCGRGVHHRVVQPAGNTVDAGTLAEDLHYTPRFPDLATIRFGPSNNIFRRARTYVSRTCVI